MDSKIMKCSMNSHEEKNAIKFCIECNIFMCHQCFNHHKGLFNDKHHLLDITENDGNIFTGLCTEENHSDKLDHFCKTHNQLCCISCIGTNSKHNNCQFCKIEDIKEEKKENLEKNVKALDDISNNLKESLIKLKDFSEKIEEQKEELKSKIMKTMTSIRNKLNEREDELLSNLESIFLDIYPSESIIQEYERLPKKISELIKKGIMLIKNWMIISF